MQAALDLQYSQAVIAQYMRTHITAFLDAAVLAVSVQRPEDPLGCAPHTRAHYPSNTSNQEVGMTHPRRLTAVFKSLSLPSGKS